MAECLKPNESHESSNQIECAVCLQTCIHPAQLPCGHIFCFLCVKGIANQSKRCAMCRHEIPSDFLEHPKIVELASAYEEFEGGYQWFYEGRNGWWQYDERTSKELELSYKSGERTCELLIAGFLYIVDFDSMIQRRRNDPVRRRRIKRDLATIPKKGIAGLKLSGEHASETQTRSNSPVPQNQCPTPPVTPSECPQTPVEHPQSQQNTIESLQSTMESLSLLTNNENDDNENHNENIERRSYYY